MTPSPASSGERRPDLTACDREPIHVPGHIQPHGVLIATHPGDLRISHVSANLQASTGLEPSLVLDTDLTHVLGASALEAIETYLTSDLRRPTSVSRVSLPLPVKPDRDVSVHRHLGRTIVELEEPASHEGPSVQTTQWIISNLGGVATVERLCDVAAETVRRLTGYDRVMVYRFGPEGHGTVVAEQKAEDIEPYLGLRYPASDVPVQARQLYVLQRLRTIPDVLYAPVGLLADGGCDLELDMSFCALRGVSPVHLEYMRNMGVRATMAISLLRDSELWGMIVCHHRRPMATDPHLRGLCELIGQIMSVLLHRTSDTAALADRLRRHNAVIDLEAQIKGAPNIAAALARQKTGMLALMNATGALISIGGRGYAIGSTPPLDQALAMMGDLRRTHGDEILAVADAGAPGGAARDHADMASGILMMPILNNPDDAIAWFRPEMRQTVLWAGNPEKAVIPGPDGQTLSPRKSFSAWAEIVQGCSEPWTAIDVEAARELRRMVTGVLLSHAEAQLAHLSAYDPLTTLANRRTLKSRMDDCAADPAHAGAAMLFLDLDRFKAINDVLGHLAGDQVLIEVAARLDRLTPKGAVAGRLGGDEFVVFWPGAGRQEAEALADQLIEAMAQPFTLSDQTLRVTASIGIAWSDLGGLDRLMPQADEAMYAAKRRGGGAVSAYHPVFHATALKNLRLEQDLFRALHDGEFTVHYQPIFRPADRTLLGFEALARWRDPDRGWIPPTEFIPVAEESGLITRLGEQVLARAINQLGQWTPVAGPLRMSVNVSALQLIDGALCDFLADLLDHESVAADHLEIEVTESVLMRETALAQLHRLRGMGVRIAIDDFGTGYSSLAYLQELPVDGVKIDQRFVRPLGSTPKADRVFQAIVSLARTYGLSLVAEGCETEEQLRVIREAGCDAVQGWLLGAGASPEDIAATYLRRAGGVPALSTPGPWGGTESR